ncbi:uncharacterized protein TrAtP1_011663 [Trichoderma atroviride]|uniref:uncharacterized protein n=1 Tax=Hypocrea atroviridis TaxID=63577 RepID=UPI003317ED6B|nr:hypothetical protein TrAtP1_011663 [Trichoderma atroviride]
MDISRMRNSQCFKKKEEKILHNLKLKIAHFVMNGQNNCYRSRSQEFDHLIQCNDYLLTITGSKDTLPHIKSSWQCLPYHEPMKMKVHQIPFLLLLQMQRIQLWQWMRMKGKKTTSKEIMS